MAARRSSSSTGSNSTCEVPSDHRRRSCSRTWPASVSRRRSSARGGRKAERQMRSSQARSRAGTTRPACRSNPAPRAWAGLRMGRRYISGFPIRRSAAPARGPSATRPARTPRRGRPAPAPRQPTGPLSRLRQGRRGASAAVQPAARCGEHGLQLHFGRGPGRMKRQRPWRVRRIHPVEHQGMDVHVEIQGRPEPLDDDHGAATPAGHTLLARAPA